MIANAFGRVVATSECCKDPAARAIAVQQHPRRKSKQGSKEGKEKVKETATRVLLVLEN